LGSADHSDSNIVHDGVVEFADQSDAIVHAGVVESADQSDAIVHAGVVESQSSTVDSTSTTQQSDDSTIEK